MEKLVEDFSLEFLELCFRFVNKGSSINNVTPLWGGGQGFYEEKLCISLISIKRDEKVSK